MCDNDLEVFSNFRQSLIIKQKKLYSQQLRSEKVITDEDPKVTIKTELDDSNYEENIFIDCTTFISSSDLKIEETAETSISQTTTRKLRKQPEVNNEEHQKLLEEFRLVLHNRKDKNVSCPRCFKLLHRDSIKEHINVVHFKQNKFQCEEKGCDYTASRYARLMMHMKAIHKSTIDPKYEKVKPKRQCNVCGTMVKNWRRHAMKVHLGIKNFYCDGCGHGTFFKSDMEIHMKSHLRKEPKEPQKFFCEMCGLIFEKRFHLSKYERYFSLETQRRNHSFLDAHVKAKHTAKERIHQCTICEKCMKFLSHFPVVRRKKSFNEFFNEQSV